MRAAMRRSWVTTTRLVRRSRFNSSISSNTAFGIPAVEIAGGLIRQHEFRLRDERARNGGTLALTTGKLMRNDA